MLMKPGNSPLGLGEKRELAKEATVSAAEFVAGFDRLRARKLASQKFANAKAATAVFVSLGRMRRSRGDVAATRRWVRWLPVAEACWLGSERPRGVMCGAGVSLVAAVRAVCCGSVTELGG